MRPQHVLTADSRRHLLALVAALLAAAAVLAITGAGHASAAGSCSPPSLVNGLSASIDTSGGCNNSNGQAGSPVTGWVADNPGAGQSVQLFAGLEGLSTHNFYSGAYVLCLAPTDGSVSQKCSTFTVQAGTGSYPKTPPTFT